jgi:hypothetical protein
MIYYLQFHDIQYSIISAELFVSQFDETFRKGPIWFVWNSTCLFFKILTLNRNINTVSFGRFLTVHNVFLIDFLLRKIACGLLNPFVGIFQISLPVTELLTNTFTTVRDAFLT